jgi:predicted O-methyltransferase YrrM
MSAGNDERSCGAVDQEAFEKVIRDNLSPEGVAAIIAFLQSAAFYKPANDDARQALRQVEWFADTLTEMLGVDEHNRLIDELGL